MSQYSARNPVLMLLAIASIPLFAPENAIAQHFDPNPIPRETELAQSANPLEIRDYQIISTETGIAIIFDTSTTTIPTLETEIVDNTLIVEIPNAVLLTPEERIEELPPIAGITDVNVSPTPDGGVRLIITGSDQAPQAEAILNEQGLVFEVTTTTVPSENIELVVTSEFGREDYYVPDTTTATRTDTPIEEVPQSIQVIPESVLQDQAVNTLDDALRNVSGVLQNSADARGQRFVVRGFDSASVLRDGFRQTFGLNGNIGYPELSNIERVEVLKGPSAILYGVSEPGGVINLVSEPPLSEPFYEASIEVSNRGLPGISVDLSGPVTEDETLLYRLNASYRNTDYYRDFEQNIERFFIAPVLEWQMSDRTDINLFLEFYDEERPYDTGLVAIGNEVANVPYTRNFSDPDDNTEAIYLRTGYRFEHRFSDNWKIRNAFNYRKYDTVFESSFLLNTDEDTGDLRRSYIQLDQPSTTYEVQTNVVGEFATGSVEHTLLFGVDYIHREQVGNIGRGFSTNFTLNIYNPVYNTVPEPNFSTESIFFDGDTYTDAVGIYIQDQIDLTENLHLLAGVRYDTVDQRFVNRPSFFNRRGFSDARQNNDAFVPRFGIVYQPIEPISLYGSYSQSFAPNIATTVSGDILEPEKGEQFEVGVRAEALGGRLSANLAYFDITKSNVATSDPNNPAFSVNAGEQRSQGVELDIIGEVLPGWNLILNYAYTDARIVADNDGQIGNKLINAPNHNFNFWSQYEIQQGSLEGLSFGLGFNYVGQRFGDLDNSFRLGSYFLTNAAIAYEQDNWRAAINVRNLFDVAHITGTRNSRSEVFPGEGVTVVGSFSIEF